jgi:hypothetical protein
MIGANQIIARMKPGHTQAAAVTRAEFLTDDDLSLLDQEPLP